MSTDNTAPAFKTPTPDQILAAKAQLPDAMERLAVLRRQADCGFAEEMTGDPADPATRSALRTYQQWHREIVTAKLHAAAVMVAAGAVPVRVCVRMRIGYRGLWQHMRSGEFAHLVAETPPEDYFERAL
ncbi:MULTISPECIES: hypothetical protein [Mycolicibacterium]|uniref:hypothetical protein n=1 Tax=Mycolicibacterium TaxID=1866885 RepID=UPI0007E98DBF|nr:hypothetical protein [Mycolicibacterium fortuitum]OBG24063.1 hypothetical protein A5768_22070 [Mycolicibacterium fortuitum]